MNQRILLPAKSYADGTSDVFQPLTCLVQFDHSAAVWLLGVMEEVYEQREKMPMLSAFVLHQNNSPLYTARPALMIEVPQLYGRDPNGDGVNWLSCEQTNLVIAPEHLYWQSRDKENQFIIETAPLDLSFLTSLATEEEHNILNMIAGGFQRAVLAPAPQTSH